MSPIPDDYTLAVDALVMDWSNLYGYAYPPTGLLRQVIKKIVAHRCTIILIAPHWPYQSWYPDMVKLSMELPIPLPLSSKLLQQPQSHIFHQYPWRLASYTCKLSEKESRTFFFL